MLELITVFVTGTVSVCFIGYMTPKFAIWGSLGTLMLWLMAHLIPSFTPSEVINTIGPHIMDLFLVYPTAISLAFGDMTASEGILGGIVVIVIGIIWLIPYIIGLILGVTTWPELFIFRVFL